MLETLYVELPSPTMRDAAFMLFGLLIGLPAPYWYAAERVQGFIRTVLDKLPYTPPPHMDEEEALEEASEQGE